MRTLRDENRNQEPSSTIERENVLDLCNDPIQRRAWLLFLAQKTLPFDQAIEAARAAEQFITGSAQEARLFMTNPGLPPGRPVLRRGRIRDSVLELINAEQGGLSRGEILERLHLKGDKPGEASVSNALNGLMKQQEIVRRERKYRVE